MSIFCLDGGPAVQARTASPLRACIALEALRGIAALAVTIWHLACFKIDDFAVDVVHKYCMRYPLYLSVDFFLVLSGFVLSCGYKFSCNYGGMVLRFRFLGYRMARLFPMYAFAALVMLGVGLHTGVDPVNAPDWTVPVECGISAIFCASFSHKAPLPILILLGAASQAALAQNASTLNLTTPPWNQLRCASAFVFGIAGERLYSWLPATEGRVAITCVATIAEVVLAGAVAYGILFPVDHSDFVAPWIFTCVVVVFARGQGLLSYVLSFVRIFGTISYSIYLNHWVVITGLKQFGSLQSGALIEIIVFWAVLLPYSFLTYYAFEKPANTILRGLVDSFLPPDDSPVLAPPTGRKVAPTVGGYETIDRRELVGTRIRL